MKRFLATVVSVLALVASATGPLVPAASAQDRTIGQRVDDTVLTTAVKAKLVADRAKNMVNVNVDVKDGVVHLRGTVATEADKYEAERLAARTQGVKAVVNELTTQETGAASPRTR
jgi:hyperosmotically inducible periplasmic protein